MSIIPELKVLITRRLRVAGLLYVLGLGAYLVLSESNVNIKLLTIVMQVAFLLAISFLFWVAPRSTAARICITVAFIIAWSSMATYIDSRFIAALRPLHPTHFAVSLSGYLLEATLFLGLTWIFERFGTTLRIG